MLIHIQDDIIQLQHCGLLDRMLRDKTTKKNIMWATDAYAHLGHEYERNEEIRLHLITGEHIDVIKTRARKEFEQQNQRTRKRAEVFTPMWVCRLMNDKLDEEWFGYPSVFFKDDTPTEEVRFFEKKRTWQHYVDSRRLEITCGEAPYLVSRYDVATGEILPIEKRCGILDRKLRVITENTATEEEWLKWATRALQATYGYEFQGDNLLIARINLLCTVEEYYEEKWKRRLMRGELEKLITIITWNIWQMDGLTYTVPFREAQPEFMQLSLFDDVEKHSDEAKQPLCRVYDWRSDRSGTFIGIKEGDNSMEFDFIIGNPPYQDETIGDNKGFAPPIYNLFLDNAYEISDRVEMIHPARFLFNAGSTPKAWNQKMLNDKHLKVLFHEQVSGRVFANTDIKGGIVITYHDKRKDFGAIGVYTIYPELNNIKNKAAPKSGEKSLADIIFTQCRFDLDVLYADYPELKSVIGSNGKDRRFRNNAFDKIPVFKIEQYDNNDIKVLGILKNKRVWRFISNKYVDKTHENLFSWKVLVPRANGSGAIGEVLSTPLIGSQLIGYTQSFIGIGSFEREFEAEALLKYVKSKFARTMLGILKVTQDNDREVWRLVPLQDFTANSDIDWSKPVAEIDRQLYAKYGLDETEIAFIESHVKEMV